MLGLRSLARCVLFDGCGQKAVSPIDAGEEKAQACAILVSGTGNQSVSPVAAALKQAKPQPESAQAVTWGCPLHYIVTRYNWRNGLIVDSRAKDTANRGFIIGWKEIAQYLNKSVRTVQRYEKELMLPVRRTAGSKGPVMAAKADLDRWVLAASMQETPSRFMFQRLRKRIQQMRNIEDKAKHVMAQLYQLHQKLR